MSQSKPRLAYHSEQPKSPQKGDIYYDDDSGYSCVWTSRGWTPLSNCPEDRYEDSVVPNNLKCVNCGASIKLHQSHCEYCKSHLSWIQK
jgi:hypothetical protein